MLQDILKQIAFNKPLQLTPSLTKPVLQTHLYEPGVLKHVPLKGQVKTAHSSLSSNGRRK